MSFLNYRYCTLPFDTMGGGEHVSVVDQCAAAVELIEIRQTDHPREFVYARRVTAHDFRVDVRRSATFFRLKT